MRFVSDWVDEWFEGPMPSLLDAERMLTAQGVEVESVVADSDVAERIVIGQVLEKGQHPNADRLSLCSVDVGDPQPLQIVCGAPNHRRGDKVAVARVGVTLPGGMTLAPVEIRGVASVGMMCSEKELGLSDEDTGIMILAADAPVGESLASHLRSTGRFIFELSVTANRGDALSMVGLARELCLADTSRRPKALAQTCVERGGAYDLRVDLRADGCPFYATRLVRGVTVARSPEWLAHRLTAVGIRSINNVVDITNYVLMSMGQPLHAFDADRLLPADGRLTMGVREAEAGEQLVTLDEVTRTLNAGDLVVCDGERPVALAGVMGGAATEVGSATTTVLIEAACFDPASVRRTARRTALHSDSSHRFERGVDPQRVLLALDYAAGLLAELAGGEVAKGRQVGGEVPCGPPPIVFDRSRACQLLGMELAPAEACDMLTRLGCKVEGGSTGLWTVTPPSWRPDLLRPVDLAEELLRIAGLDRVPECLPSSAPPAGRLSTFNPAIAVAQGLRTDLCARGFFEAVSLAFVSPAWVERLAVKGLPLANPLGEETRFLRPSLCPALIDAAARNLRHGQPDAALVEYGTCFTAAGETLRLAWIQRAAPGASGLAEVRALLEAMLAGRGVGEVNLEAEPHPILHPRSAAQVVCGGESLGVIGELHPDLRSANDFGEGWWLVELDVAAVAAAAKALAVFGHLARYPAVHRDLALVVAESQAAGDLAGLASKLDSSLAVRARVFDVYSGPGVDPGCKSVGVRFTLQSADGTLKDKQVDRWLKTYCAEAEKLFNARLRA
jgi:phenylalanyl-tRNA synthetase beta chain